MSFFCNCQFRQITQKNIDLLFFLIYLKYHPYKCGFKSLQFDQFQNFSLIVQFPKVCFYSQTIKLLRDFKIFQTSTKIQENLYQWFNFYFGICKQYFYQLKLNCYTFNKNKPSNLHSSVAKLMQSKSQSVQYKDSTKVSYEKPTSNSVLQSLTNSIQFTIYKVSRGNKDRRELGQYYRIEKTFYYRQKIMALHMLSVLLSGDGQLIRTNAYHKSLLNFIMQAVRKFEEKMISQTGMLEENESELGRIKALKNRLEALLDKHSSKLDFEDFELIVNMMIDRWLDDNEEAEGLVSDMKFVYGQLLVISEEYPQYKITQLVINTSPNFQSPASQMHLLYRQFQISLSSTPIAKIIETNHEQYVYFSLFPLPAPKCRISELFHGLDQNNVVQSEGENTESDSKSEIILDEEFYRISSRIISSVRKDSFYSGGETIGEEKSIQERGFLPSGNEIKPNLMGNQILQFKNCLCNSLIPSTLAYQNLPTPASQMQTWSSSIERSNFLRDNLSTSIDLHMRSELEAENRRKKSCENSRTCQQSTEKSYLPIMYQSPFDSKADPKLMINLLNQDHRSFFNGSFMVGKKVIGKRRTEKEVLGSNKRLWVARSFFRKSGERV